MARRVAVYYASLGACYKEAAEAMCEWSRALFPDCETMCRDVMDYVPRVMRGAIVSAYNGVTRRAPWLWDRIYRDTDVPSARNPVSAFWNDLHRRVGGINIKRLLKDLDAFAPSVVFATNFFGMTAFLDKWVHRAPVFFVCTDYLSHVFQRDPRYDGWFVGSDEAVRQYAADNVPTSEYAVKNFGIPISRDYLVPPSREESRRILEIGEGELMASVVDSGAGARQIDVVADSMVDLAEWRIFVICRDNRKLYEHLRDKYFPFKHMTVLNDVPDVTHYYAASDAVILDPNGVRIAEAAAVGAAMLLMDPLPGLGRYNCDYLLERGAARKIYEHRRTGELLRELVRSRESLERMKYRARAMSRPNAGMDAVTWAMERADDLKRQREAGEAAAKEGQKEERPEPDAGDREPDKG